MDTLTIHQQCKEFTPNMAFVVWLADKRLTSVDIDRRDFLEFIVKNKSVLRDTFQCVKKLHFGFYEPPLREADLETITTFCFELCPNADDIYIYSQDNESEVSDTFKDKLMNEVFNKVLKRVTTLHIFDADGYDMAQNISNAIIKNPPPHLSCIRMVSTFTGIKEFSRAIAKCPELKRLELEYNSFDDYEAEKLVKAIVKCKKMEELTILEDEFVWDMPQLDELVEATAFRGHLTCLRKMMFPRKYISWDTIRALNLDSYNQVSIRTNEGSTLDISVY